MRKLLLLLLVLLIAGCGILVVDGTNENTVKNSVEKMRNALSPEKQILFDNALQKIALSFTYKHMKTNSDIRNPYSKTPIDEIREMLSGKSVDEILKLSESLPINDTGGFIKTNSPEERKQKFSAQLIKAENDLKILLEEKSIFFEKLKAFIIVITEFSIKKVDYGYLEKERFEVKIKCQNNTDKAISEVEFNCILKSKSRAVPWKEKECFEYFPGGIEPGEVKEWSFYPFGDDSLSYIPEGTNDLILSIEVSNLYGADKKPIYEIKWNKYKQESLEFTISNLKNN